MPIEVLYSLGGLGAILYVAYVMIRKAKVESIIAKLEPRDNRKELEEIAVLTQEVVDAKIKYENARRDVDAFTSRTPQVAPRSVSRKDLQGRGPK